MLTEAVAFVRGHLGWALVAAVAVWLLKNRFNRRLHRYPGPLLAGLTDWWRLWKVYLGNFEQVNISLHRQYGDVVRLGPNLLSFADPRAIKIIYGLNKGYIKVNCYAMLRS
jgi:hypothetical protein